MADDVDIATEHLEEVMEHTMITRKKEREFAMHNLPLCENFIDCGKLTFITDKGTVSRFCPSCWAEFKASQCN